jgi:hypothetical protein
MKALQSLVPNSSKVRHTLLFLHFLLRCLKLIEVLSFGRVVADRQSIHARRRH